LSPSKPHKIQKNTQNTSSSTTSTLVLLVLVPKSAKIDPKPKVSVYGIPLQSVRTQLLAQPCLQTVEFTFTAFYPNGNGNGYTFLLLAPRKKVHFFLAFPSTFLVKLGGFHIFVLVLTYVSLRSPLRAEYFGFWHTYRPCPMIPSPSPSPSRRNADACILYLDLVFFTHVMCHLPLYDS
jgi:hypothetical protein